MRQPLTFLAVLLVSALASHGLFSAAVSAWIAGTTSHRLLNVRNIEDVSQWGTLARLFVEGQAVSDPRPKILLFGSSVTWGYEWPEADVFSSHLQGSLDAYQVLNVGVIGMAFSGVADIECHLLDSDAEIAIAVLEVNLFNFRPLTAQTVSTCSTSADYIALGGPINYLHYTLVNPFGIEYIKMFWINFVLSGKEREYEWAELPDSYFPNRGEFAESAAAVTQVVGTAVSRARMFADKVVVFIAPTLREGLERSGYDPADIEEISGMIMAVCEQTREATCLDPGFALSRESYYNLTHLNRRGHEAFADWLLRRLPLSDAGPGGWGGI